MSEEDVERAPEYVTGHLRDALAQDPRSSELDVQVSVQGDTIRLDGFAATAEHRDAVSQVAQEVAGHRVVRNEMTIATFPEDDRVEELR